MPHICLRTPLIEIMFSMNWGRWAMGNGMWKPQFKPNELHRRTLTEPMLFILSIKQFDEDDDDDKRAPNARVSVFAEFPWFHIFYGHHKPATFPLQIDFVVLCCRGFFLLLWLYSVIDVLLLLMLLYSVVHLSNISDVIFSLFCCMHWCCRSWFVVIILLFIIPFSLFNRPFDRWCIRIICVSLYKLRCVDALYCHRENDECLSMLPSNAMVWIGVGWFGME